MRAKELEGEVKKVGDGALTGGTGRETIPPDMPMISLRNLGLKDERVC